MARSFGSIPAGACTLVPSLQACIPASDKATCRNHPTGISFRGRRELEMVQERRLSGLCKQAPLPLNQGCSVGVAAAVCSLAHASMGRLLVSSMAEFKVNFPLQF